jgi:hypothetical protein
MRSIENHDTLSSNIQQLTLILWIQKIRKKTIFYFTYHLELRTDKPDDVAATRS